VNGFNRERWDAHRDVLRAARFWCTVTHPLTAPNDNGLTSHDSMVSRASLDSQQATQHDGVFVELRRLPRLASTSRTDHARDAHAFRAGVYSPDELLNLLGWYAVGLKALRGSDAGCHQSNL